MKRGFALYLALLTSTVMAGEDFSFDPGAFQKQPGEWGGYMELRPEYLSLDRNSLLYKLNYGNTDQPEHLTRYNEVLELQGSYQIHNTSVHGRYHVQGSQDEIESDSQQDLYEAYVAHRVGEALTLEAGKRVLKWGKGYAWNPVGFMERSKDPVDPDLSREGFWLLTADMISSPGGDLKTLAFTPVVLPVSDSVNTDFGEPDHVNLGGKLYFLYRDMDIDILGLSSGSRPGRLGVDLSTNLDSNFEIHAEAARVFDQPLVQVSDTGSITQVRKNISRYLLGLRYLTQSDVTLIAEYYHNGGGYTADELQGIYSSMDTAISGNDAATLSALTTAGKNSYLAPNPQQNYGYLRISWKEPFDIVYFTPSATVIRSLDDHSQNLVGELLYTGVNNLELRFRLLATRGRAYTEFGEKSANWKTELRLRLYF